MHLVLFFFFCLFVFFFFPCFFFLLRKACLFDHIASSKRQNAQLKDTELGIKLDHVDVPLPKGNATLFLCIVVNIFSNHKYTHSFFFLPFLAGYKDSDMNVYVKIEMLFPSETEAQTVLTEKKSGSASFDPNIYVKVRKEKRRFYLFNFFFEENAIF